jgi:hypothetical protein
VLLRLLLGTIRELGSVVRVGAVQQFGFEEPLKLAGDYASPGVVTVVTECEADAAAAPDHRMVHVSDLVRDRLAVPIPLLERLEVAGIIVRRRELTLLGFKEAHSLW